MEFCTQEANGHVMLSIRDNGIGIPAEDLERVFDKGFVGSNGRGTKTGERSTGIGLYLCDRLCAKLGIDIRIIRRKAYTRRFFCIFPKKKPFQNNIRLKTESYKTVI